MTDSSNCHSATHSVASGMGGRFRVRILSYPDGVHARVRVTTTNPDWDGFEFVCQQSDLAPLLPSTPTIARAATANRLAKRAG